MRASRVVRRLRTGTIFYGGGIAAVLAILCCVFAAPAGATQYQHPFEGALGSSGEEPTFQWPSVIAIDPTSEDILVADYLTGTVSRFTSSGAPAEFSALGSNVIDGIEGPDETPEAGLEIGIDSSSQQIAISPTNGNIYVTQRSAGLVDIFSTEGNYLGQLTADDDGRFPEPRGVAVSSSGAVFVSSGDFSTPFRIAEFVPGGSGIPTNADNTKTLPVAGYGSLRSLALGSGPTGGWLFAGTEGSSGANIGTLKLNVTTGAYHLFASGFGGSIAVVEPQTGNVLLKTVTFESAEAVEFDGSAEEVEPSDALSRLRSLQGELNGAAPGSSGHIYTVTGPADPHVFIYGPPAVVPTVVSNPASSITGTKATLSGSVDADGTAVEDCMFEWGVTVGEHFVPCEGEIPEDASPHEVHANISPLEANGTEYRFRLAAKNANGTEYSVTRSFATAHTVVTEPASELGTVAATLNGTVRPEGSQYSACFFRWGLAGHAGYEHMVPCSPPAGAISPDFAPHAVNAPVAGLEPGTRYKFRLVATNPEGTLEGEELYLRTLGPPQLSEVRARNATQSTALIEAQINPSGFGTSYQFQWGTTSTYGHATPVAPEYVGKGSANVHVTATLYGLSASSVYHYRILAKNTEGETVVSADQVLETLNTCGATGLPQGRCYELVSPRNLGPVAQPGRFLSGTELSFQASDAPGSLAYLIGNGQADATRGTEVMYRGLRGDAGWDSSQLAPGITTRNERKTEFSNPGEFLGLSPDLSCGVVDSAQPLTADPAARLLVEAGGTNLYRLNTDGSYTLITELPPEPLVGQGGLKSEYRLVGMSTDCSKIVFETKNFKYSGIPGEGQGRLYEWSAAGGLKNVGFVPGEEGDEPVAAVGGAIKGSGVDFGRAVEDQYRVVSADGSRVFFTSTRLLSNNTEEVGRTGVFVRIDGASTTDVSQSKTAIPDNGAVYQGATPDGSRAYFIANYGLTSDTSSGPTVDNCTDTNLTARTDTHCDLYEYNLSTDELTDLSADTSDPEGAEVAALVGVSQDGSHAYFVARGQLEPGAGNSASRNNAANTYSLYDASHGTVRYVGTVSGKGEEAHAYVSLEAQVAAEYTSRVSATGRYLIFESSEQQTTYDNEGVREAYLYDAQNQAEPVVCVSCRQDGLPPIRKNDEAHRWRLSSGENSNPLYESQSLVVQAGSPEVFFVSREDLAEGAVDGDWNLYEWAHGQVFHIATEAGGGATEEGNGYIQFAGASADGSDIYFYDAASLNWENPGARPAAWDARIGGGFAQPVGPPAPCNPASEDGGSCQGASPVTPAAPAAGTAGFQGAGNVKPHEHKKKHKKHRKHRKAKGKKHKGKKGKKHKGKKGKKHKGKKGGKGKRMQQARGNGRAGK